MHILITGAAAGIGAEIAKVFDENESCVFSLVDINSESLGEIQAELKNEAKVFQGDLTDIDALPELTAKIIQANGPVDLLVNNAGIMLVGKMSSMGWETGLRQLELNLIAPLRLVNLVLPPMIERGEGAIINISSMAALTPIPGCSYYSSSKAGIAIASEALEGELKNTGVHVLTVYPGPVRTFLEQNARSLLEYSFVRDMIPVGKKERIAHRIYKAHKKKKSRLVYPGAYSLARHFPGLNYFFTKRFSPQPVN